MRSQNSNRLHIGVAYLSLAGLIALALYVFMLPQHFAYVNSAKLINDYKGMQDARNAYQKKATVWKANVDTLSTQVQRQIVDFQRNSSQLSVKERALTEELIKTKQRQLNDYQQAIADQAKSEDEKMTADVMQEINTYLKNYGAAKGYKIVMAANEYGNIAYADEGLDITDDVIEGLNAEYGTR